MNEQKNSDEYCDAIKDLAEWYLTQVEAITAEYRKRLLALANQYPNRSACYVGTAENPGGLRTD